MNATAPQTINLDTMPGFGPPAPAQDMTKYRVRYLKVDMDEAGDILELEALETRGLRAKEIVIMNKDKFTFMQKYFLIVTYLELIDGPT